MYQINENGFEILGLSEEMEDDNDSSKFDLAKRFIQENLSKGPITSIDIKFKALSEKISISTLKRAKKELNVKSYQINQCH